jgi:hypothetical protein
LYTERATNYEPFEPAIRFPNIASVKRTICTTDRISNSLSVDRTNDATFFNSYYPTIYKTELPANLTTVSSSIDGPECRSDVLSFVAAVFATDHVPFERPYYDTFHHAVSIA